MKKRILSLLLCLMMLVSLLPMQAIAAEATAPTEQTETDGTTEDGTREDATTQPSETTAPSEESVGSEESATEEPGEEPGEPKEPTEETEPGEEPGDGAADEAGAPAPSEDGEDDKAAEEDEDADEEAEDAEALAAEALEAEDEELGEEDEDGEASERVKLLKKGVLYYGKAPEGAELKVSGRTYFKSDAIEAANAKAYEAEEESFTLSAKSTISLVVGEEAVAVEGRAKLIFTGVKLGEGDSVEILRELSAEEAEALAGDPTVEVRGGKTVQVYSLANKNLTVNAKGMPGIWVRALPGTFTVQVTYATKAVEAQPAEEEIAEQPAEEPTEETTPADKPSGKKAEDEAEAESQLRVQSLTQSYGSYQVTVSGSMPEGMRVVVGTASQSAAEKVLDDAKVAGIAGEVKSFIALDVKLVGADGQIWQPEQLGVTVSIAGLDVANADRVGMVHVLDDAAAIEANGSAVMLHDSMVASTMTAAADAAQAVTGESDAIVYEDAAAEETDEGVSAEVTSFSTFIAYTVDFHNGDAVFSIPGESSVLLSEVFAQLGYDYDVADVVNVSFSDPSLLAVEKVDGDWLLTSLAPFQTDETLTIVFKDGTELKMLVTDSAQTSSNTVDFGGTNDKQWAEIYITVDGNKAPGAQIKAVKGDNGEVSTSKTYTLDSDACIWLRHLDLNGTLQVTVLDYTAPDGTIADGVKMMKKNTTVYCYQKRNTGNNTSTYGTSGYKYGLYTWNAWNSGDNDTTYRVGPGGAIAPGSLGYVWPTQNDSYGAVNRLTISLTTPTYTVTYAVSPSGGGTLSRTSDTVHRGQVVAKDAASNNTGYTLTKTYPTATPATGYRFTGWSTDVQRVTGNVTITANFEKIKYTVSGSIDNGGTVTNGSQTVEYGANSKAMTFTPASGYKITGITVNGTAQTVSNENSYTYPAQSNVTANITVNVTTAKKATFTVKGTIDHGTVTNGNQTITQGDSSKAMVFTPTSGYKITGITVNGTAQTVSNENSYTYPVQSNVTANITVNVTTEKKATFTVKGTIDNGGTVTNGNQTVAQGDNSQAMVFTPATGYKITGITVNGTAQTVSNENSYIYGAQSNVTSNITVNVTTEKKTYTVTGSIDNGGSVTNGNQTGIQHGTNNVAMVFTPATGYKITGITINGVSQTVSNENSYTFPAQAITENKTVVVKTEQNTYTVTGSINNGGTVTNANQTGIVHGTNNEAMVFTPATGYEITGISINGVSQTVSDSDKDGYTFPAQAITEDKAVVVTTQARTDTAYTVKHILVAVDGTETVKETEPLTGTTDQPTAAVAKTYDGYTVRSFEQKTIAGDGSTVVEIRYDENKVTIGYQIVGLTEGGTLDKTSETVGVFTGSPSATVTLSSAGYKLLGWFDNEACTGDALSTELSFAPAKVDGKHVEKTYYAKIVPAQITVTGRVAEGSHGQIAGLPQTIDYGTQLPENITFISDYGYKNDHVTSSVELEWAFNVTDTTWANFIGTPRFYEDTELVLYTVPYQYTITYDLNGGSLPEGVTETTLSYNIESTDKLMVPAERPGWVFGGWKVTETNESITQSNWVKDNMYSTDVENPMAVTGMYGDVSLEAQWTPVTTVLTVKVQLDQEDDTTRDYGNREEAFTGTVAINKADDGSLAPEDYSDAYSLTHNDCIAGGSSVTVTAGIDFDLTPGEAPEKYRLTKIILTHADGTTTEYTGSLADIPFEEGEITVTLIYQFDRGVPIVGIDEGNNVPVVLLTALMTTLATGLFLSNRRKRREDEA